MDEQLLYEGLIEEEDGLVGKLTACEGFFWNLLEHVARGASFAEEPAERLLGELDGMEREWRTELWHLRLEKALLESKIRNRITDYARTGVSKIGPPAKKGDGAE